MVKTLERRLYYGQIIHSISLKELEYINNGLIAINQAGQIQFLDRNVESTQLNQLIKERGWSEAKLIKLNKGEFLIPGLIDTHTHASQFTNLGNGQQYELLDWLTHLTFPTEAKFADPIHAKSVYESVVQRVINTGTTTCCYYGTLHLTTKILASICHRKGQRAFVGKCNMDRNSAPDYTEESPATSLADTQAFINYVRTHCVSPTPIAAPDGTLPLQPIRSQTRSPIERSARSLALAENSKQRADSPSNARLAKNMWSPTSLVQPVLTPRFAISCSDELLEGLGMMMDKDPSLTLQTHLAENPTEITFTKTLYPEIDTYTAVYDKFNLLRKNTILAHCTHLEQSEMDLIKDRNSGVSHCPTSNFNLRSGMSSVGEMLDRGIKVALGTDNSGGFAVGILSAIRQASICSKVLAVQHRDAALSDSLASIALSASASTESQSNYFSTHYLSIATLFYLATLGGAQVCNLEDRIGNFKVGKEFDALLIITGQPSVTPIPTTNGVDDEEEEEDSNEDEEVVASGVNPNMFVEAHDSIETLFEKFLFTGDDRNIGSVFVRGRIIGGAKPLL